MKIFRIKEYQNNGWLGNHTKVLNFLDTLKDEIHIVTQRADSQHTY